MQGFPGSLLDDFTVSTASLYYPFQSLNTFVTCFGFFSMISNWSVPAYACCFPQWKGYCGLPRRLHLLYICPLISWWTLKFIPAFFRIVDWPSWSLLVHHVLQHPYHHRGSLWSFCFMSASFPHWVAQNCTQFSRFALTLWMGIATFLKLLAILFLWRPRMLLTFFVARSLLTYLLLTRTFKFLFENPFLLL